MINNTNQKEKKVKTVIHHNSRLQTIKINDVVCVMTKARKRIIGTIDDNGKFHQDPLVVRTFQNLLDMSKSCGYPGYEVVETA